MIRRKKDSASIRTNREMWESYDFYMSELSRLLRQIAFGNLAVCWMLQTSDYHFPNRVLWSMGFTVLFFLLDLAQYRTGAHVVKQRVESREQQCRDAGLDFDGQDFSLESG